MKKYENEERIEKTIGNELSDTELGKVAGGAGEGGWEYKIRRNEGTGGSYEAV